MSIYGFTIQDMIANGRIDEIDLSILKEWVATQQMPRYSDETIALFYMSCDKNIEATKKCAIANTNSKKKAPEIFNDRNLSRKDVQQQLKIANVCVSPQRTDEGHAVVLCRLLDPDPSLYNMVVAMKVYFMTLDTILYDDPPTGIITICDMTGTSLRHLSCLDISAVEKFMHFIQQGLPLKIVSVEVLNTVWFYDMLFRIVKPFLNKNLVNLIHFHTSNLDMEDFYKNHVPKKCLFSDYGGDLLSIAELQNETLKKLADLSDYFKNEELSRIIQN